MGEKRLSKRAGKIEEVCRRRRGRQTLRWRDSVKRYIERAEVSSREWEIMAEGASLFHFLLSHAQFYVKRPRLVDRAGQTK